MMSLSKKLPLPWGDLGLHLTHGSFIGPNQVHNPNGVLNRFIRFSADHGCDQHKDTVRPRNIGSSRAASDAA